MRKKKEEIETISREEIESRIKATLDNANFINDIQASVFWICSGKNKNSIISSVMVNGTFNVDNIMGMFSNLLECITDKISLDKRNILLLFLKDYIDTEFDKLKK